MTETIVAQSTPHGVSALAVIRASGSACTHLYRKFFKFPENKEPEARHSYYSHFYNASGELIDEVIWIFYAADSSYTGEAMLEIMPHGNPIICKKIIDAFCEEGCRLADPGEFTQRAYLRGKLNFSQVEGVLDVIHAQSDRALFYARKHLTGESGRLIKGMVQDMTTIRAEIEAYIDFPEDELPPEDQSGPLQKLNRIIDTLDRYQRTARSREVLQNGLDTLIVGLPNVGKSSLLNALVGHRRALVSDQAGTTRDYIIERTFIGDYLINLFDTAGLNMQSIDRLEEEGIQHTLDLIDQADFFLVVLDSTLPAPELPEVLLKAIRPDNTLVIENKIDLKNSQTFEGFLPEFKHVRTSTMRQECLQNLTNTWKDLIEADYDAREDEGMMFNLRQAEFIRESHGELTQAREILRTSDATELAAFHLIQASEALIKINEKIDNESVLDDLFNRFCIGK